jgi:hypothetical protein
MAEQGGDGMKTEPLPTKTFEILGHGGSLRFQLLIDERGHILFERDGKTDPVLDYPTWETDALLVDYYWHDLLRTQKALRELAAALEIVKRRFVASVKDPQELGPPPEWDDKTITFYKITPNPLGDGGGDRF